MKMRSRHQLCVINKQAQHVPVWGLRFKANPKPALRAKHLPMAVSKQIQARRTSLSLQVGTGLSAFCVWAIAGKKKKFAMEKQVFSPWPGEDATGENTYRTRFRGFLNNAGGLLHAFRESFRVCVQFSSRPSLVCRSHAPPVRLTERENLARRLLAGAEARSSRSPTRLALS